MKALYTCLLMGLLAVHVQAGSPRPDEMAEGKSIALIAVGDVDEALMGRLKQHVEQTMMMRVVTLSAEGDEEGVLDDLARSLLKDLEPNHAFGVAIYAHNRGPMPHGVVLKEDRIAVVNANAMQPEDGDQEVYARRLERQAVRGVCFLLGLSYSPNMHSAMYKYENLNELDMMGRNLDPPWMIMAERAAREQGIQTLSFDQVYRSNIEAARAVEE